MGNLITVISWLIFILFMAKYINDFFKKTFYTKKKKTYYSHSAGVQNRNYHSTESFFKSREKKSLNKEFKTLKGDIVKSGGEQLIADYLYSIGVNYEYEHIYRRKDGGTNKPDFYLADYDVYIEYFGLCGVPKYNYEMHLKFDTFENEKLKVIKVYSKSIGNGKFKKAIDIQFKKFTGDYLPKKYNPEIKFYRDKNNRNFLHYYVSK